MELYRLRSQDEYLAHAGRLRDAYAKRQAIEDALTAEGGASFSVRAFSYPAGREVDLAVDWQHAYGGRINWRERLICPVTGLNNRLRAALHLLDIEAAPYPDDRIYLSEQVTPLFRHLSALRAGVTGSERLSDGTPPGAVNAAGIRHEDLTRLSFADATLGCVLSLDCFEHIPEHAIAFRECCRVLRRDGALLWSVPFDRNRAANLTRARLRSDGAIEHLCEPEYHGDPLREDGCLCFTTFGWEMLAQMRAAGFADAYAVLFWSRAFGYLGTEQVLFVARK
jgi:SAM-dependent methyltransferase